jgi:sugar lactone lactonase YvrE
MRSATLNLPMMLLLAGIVGCASSPDVVPFTEQGRTWPDLPEDARIAFVGEFAEPEDLGIRPGVWERIVRFTAGDRRDAVVRPMDVAATEGGGIIYVADPDARCVHRYDLARGRYDCLGLSRDAALPSPVGLALTPSGRLYVADSLMGGLFTIGPGDRYLQPFAGDATLERPTGLAWHEAAGLLLVSDTGSQSLKAYRSDGSFAFEFASRGIGPGEVNFPTYLWADASELLVTDSLNFRVQRFDAEGAFRASFGKNGDRAGDFARPKGVAVDSDGHVYVVDALFNGIQVFDREGRLLLAFGERGQEAGQFWLPNGLFITVDDLIFVADSYNRRVQVFRYLGSAS